MCEILIVTWTLLSVQMCFSQMKIVIQSLWGNNDSNLYLKVYLNLQYLLKPHISSSLKGCTIWYKKNNVLIDIMIVIWVMYSGNDHASQFSFSLTIMMMMWHMLTSVPNKQNVFSHLENYTCRPGKLRSTSVLVLLFHPKTLQNSYSFSDLAALVHIND